MTANFSDITRFCVTWCWELVQGPTEENADRGEELVFIG